MIYKEFDYNNIKEVAKAERFKAQLENKGLKPIVYLLGLNKLVIEV